MAREQMARRKSKGGTSRRQAAAFLLALAALVALPALALAHIERASYWPDPAPDTSVTPPAGGSVPDVRPLSTALDGSQPGNTHVVCEGSAVPKPKLRNIKKLRKRQKAAA